MSHRVRRWEVVVLVLAVAMTILRFYCAARVGLGDDESYYWDWSRRLQLSYYDHPAMTAWLIKIGTLIFGQNSLGVRFFALLCNAGSGYLLWKLATEIFDRATALIAVVFYIFAPIFSLGGILMVPDAPMGLAWVALLLIVWRMLKSDDTRLSTWLGAGLVLGLGLISKYTIILLAISLVLFLLSEPSYRRHLFAKRFWLALALAAICCLPIIIWNSQLGWPTVKYHLHDRQTGGGGASLVRWGQFWGSQAITLGPALLLLCLGTWIVAVRRFRDLRWRFIFVMTFPTFALFCFQALYAEFKPHWPAPSYSLVFIGGARLMVEGFGLTNLKNPARAVVAAFILVIFIPLNVLFYVGSLWPVIPKIARAVAPNLAFDIKFDPTNDLYGWDALAIHLNEIRAEMSKKGEPEPFLSSSRYQLTGQLAFATKETVWRVSPDNDQYKFWQTRADWLPLLGRNSLYVTDSRFERDPRNDFIFKSCTVDPPYLVYRGDELAHKFFIWRCQGFTGIR